MRLEGLRANRRAGVFSVPSQKRGSMPLVITQKVSMPEGRAAPPAAGPAAKSRGRDQGVSRRLGSAACGVGLAGSGLYEYRCDFPHFFLFLFVSLLAALAVLLPATGPRGQRVGLLPAVGVAALLLLPLPAALPPLLLTNTMYALSRQAAQSRRQAVGRGVCLLLALGAGAGVSVLFGHAPLVCVWAAAAYCGVFSGARLGAVSRHFGGPRTAYRHALQYWRLEAATLAVTGPVALLMAWVFPSYGPAGLAGTSALLALLGLVAHFGFEVAGLRGQVRAMERLSAVTVAQTSAARVTEQFLSLSRGLVSCDRTALWLTDDTDMRLKRVPGRGEAVPSETVSVRFGEGLAGRAAEHKRPFLIRDGSCDPRAAAEETRSGSGAFAVLLLPLVADSQTLGVARFERDAPGAFTHRDSARLSALASQAAATLANVRAHQDVYSQAVTDALTGLFNRRHMQTVLTDERRRAERYGHPLSVIMLDVDGFKSYNDTYGHVQGDVLLKTLAGVLQSSVRNVDIVGRFGGEEFIVVLPETPPGEAYQAAERLRQAVARTVFPGFADDPELAVFKTISLGVATYPDITQDTHALVSLADAALYKAKHGGRNQTVQAEPETAAVERE